MKDPHIKRTTINKQPSMLSDRRRPEIPQVVVPHERRKKAKDRRKHADKPASQPFANLLLELPKALPVAKSLIDYESPLSELAQTQPTAKHCHSYSWQLYHFSPIAYITLNFDGLITSVNVSGVKLLGEDSAQLHQRAFVSFLKGSNAKRWQQVFLKMLKGKPRQSTEMILVRVDGSLINVRLEGVSKEVEDGASVLLLALTNITDSKRIKSPLSAVVPIFDSYEGIMVTDAQTIILQINPAFSHLTGYSVEESVGQKPNFLSSGQQDAHFYQRMWQAINHDGYWQGEILNRHKKGGILSQWLTICAITDNSGEVIYYVGSLRDVNSAPQTDKNALGAYLLLEHQIQQKNAELQHIKEELSDINITLRVLLESKKVDNSDVKKQLEQEIKQEIVPFLQQLKKANPNTKQLSLLQILEANLQNVLSSYGRNDVIATGFKELTPKEIQVASMIRQGLSTKNIAATLSISAATVNVHRKNIRKKLGLDNKAVNLRSHLGSVD
ncbi:PAS domain S-box protein [Crenothrix sp.]|uniref:PAS domain S-box protein n=1 Tax=Crenothrix sp. TaxID=3100433 RepID=UPI00374CADC7